VRACPLERGRRQGRGSIPPSPSHKMWPYPGPATAFPGRPLFSFARVHHGYSPSVLSASSYNLLTASQASHSHNRLPSSTTQPQSVRVDSLFPCDSKLLPCSRLLQTPILQTLTRKTRFPIRQTRQTTRTFSPTRRRLRAHTTSMSGEWCPLLITSDWHNGPDQPTSRLPHPTPSSIYPTSNR
jgi:hypothetical protein